jgi:hypothetical protein
MHAPLGCLTLHDMFGLHADWVHNFYTQVAGRKRFILFPPEDFWSMYLFPAIHPSSRQSQVDFNLWNSSHELQQAFSSMPQ